MYRNAFPKSTSNVYSDHVFKVFDVDRSGFIDFTEWIVVLSLNTSTDLRKRLRLAFHIYDIDQNGTIDLNEMEKLVEAIYDLKGIPDEKRVGQDSVQAQVKEIFAKFDKNNDKCISRDEFIQGCLENRKIQEFLMNNPF